LRPGALVRQNPTSRVTSRQPPPNSAHLVAHACQRLRSGAYFGYGTAGSTVRHTHPLLDQPDAPAPSPRPRTPDPGPRTPFPAANVRITQECQGLVTKVGILGILAPCEPTRNIFPDVRTRLAPLLPPPHPARRLGVPPFPPSHVPTFPQGTAAGPRRLAAGRLRRVKGIQRTAGSRCASARRASATAPNIAMAGMAAKW
jgi:hypothetical protein